MHAKCIKKEFFIDVSNKIIYWCVKDSFLKQLYKKNSLNAKTLSIAIVQQT